MTLAAELAAMAAIERTREQADQHFGTLDKPMDEWGSKEIAQMNCAQRTEFLGFGVAFAKRPGAHCLNQESGEGVDRDSALSAPNYYTAAEAMARDSEQMITASQPSREVRRQQWALPLPGILFRVMVLLCVVAICWRLV